MQNWNRLPRFFLVLTLLIALCAGVFAPRVEKVEAKPMMVYPATSVVISEFRTRGPSLTNSATDEFIELYNPTNVPIAIGNWEIHASNNTGGGTATPRTTIPLGTILQPGQYYLIANNDYSGAVAADLSYGVGIADDGGLALTLPDDTVVDAVGMSTGSSYKEGSVLAPLTTNINQSYERYIGGANGNCQDDGNNFADFVLLNPSNPQNSTSALVLCGVPTPTPSPTNTSTSTLTPTVTSTPTNTPPFSPTPTLTPAPGEVVISEVAWAGTLATTNDEWIELYNTRSTPINISGWRLVSDSGSVDVVLNGVIPGQSFFLLERARDLTVSDVPANQIYLGALSDAGETLRLSKPDGTIIDTANSDGGSWPAGNGSPNFYSMERLINGTVIAPDNSLGWTTNNQPSTWTTHDAASNFVRGTPGLPNFNFVSTITPTRTATLTLTPTITPTPSGLRSVVINEIAWAGTISGLADDEWIELYNPGSAPIDITDWYLKSADGTPNIVLNGVIPAGGYYLLERDDNNTVFDIAADQIYTGNGLSNSGEALTLYDASNKIVDTANGNGGSWPAGSATSYATMERTLGTADSDSAWHSNLSTKRNGKNANGGDILGTPKSSNSVGPTPTPSREATDTRTPTPLPFVIDPRPIINEILPRPGFDWNQDGKVDVFDEFIEIKNLTSIDINLKGWKLDKVSGGTFILPDVVLKPNQRIVFYSLQTNLLLSDGGETVRLIHPSNGKIYDAYTYTIARAEDQSICRLPDGNVFGGWYEDCIPTPNLTNTREGSVPSMPDEGYQSPICQLPDTLPADFLFAECRGYGANIWNSFYWDQNGGLGAKNIPQNTSKWEAIIE
ncbi:MAG: lamin tail domain-containing protein [Anaerolineales bacterium]|nr:lamin tail domain-containing protein [Anaerolineales bacterium]